MGMFDKLVPTEISELTSTFDEKLDRIATALDQLLEIEKRREARELQADALQENYGR